MIHKSPLMLGFARCNAAELRRDVSVLATCYTFTLGGTTHFATFVASGDASGFMAQKAQNGTPRTVKNRIVFRTLREIRQKGECVFAQQHPGLFQVSSFERIHNRLVNLRQRTLTSLRSSAGSTVTTFQSQESPRPSATSCSTRR